MTEPIQPQGNPPVAPAKKSNTLIYVVAGCGGFLLICGLVAAVVFWWGAHKLKNYAEKTVSSGGMTRVPELWSDVPRMDGMTPAQQIDMPVTLKLLARPILDGMMRGLNNGKGAGNWDWTAYSLKGKTTTDVQNFYDEKRMTAAGWQPNGGCTTTPTSGQPTFCSFQKKEGNQTTGMLIVATNDDDNKAASMFIIRNEGMPPQ